MLRSSAVCNGKAIYAGGCLDSLPKQISIADKIILASLYFSPAQLQCPYAVKSNKASVGSGYKTLADRLTNISHMPIDVDIKQLDDGDGIEPTLMRHHAGGHKTCRLKFNQNNYRKNIGTSAVDTCSSYSSIDLYSSIDQDDKCFLCNKPAVSTMHLHTTLMQVGRYCFASQA